VRSFFLSQRTLFNSRTSPPSVNLIRINRIRPFPFGHTRTFNIRLFVGVWDHARPEAGASKLKTRSYGATVSKSFIRAWLSTYLRRNSTMHSRWLGGGGGSWIAISCTRGFPVTLRRFHLP